jgi:hypothetical protein
MAYDENSLGPVFLALVHVFFFYNCICFFFWFWFKLPLYIVLELEESSDDLKKYYSFISFLSKFNYIHSMFNKRCKATTIIEEFTR